MRETRTEEEVREFVGRVRVYAISDQDDTGGWMRREFPELKYVSTTEVGREGRGKEGEGEEADEMDEVGWGFG